VGTISLRNPALGSSISTGKKPLSEPEAALLMNRELDPKFTHPDFDHS
jgi:hypothetical protein